MTDQEIFNGIARRDNQTFSFLYQKYQGQILRMVRNNNGNEGDAIDVFQEGVIVLWTNISQGKFELKENTKISTYLYAICRNIWISKIRKEKHVQSLDKVPNLEDMAEVDEMEAHYEQIKILEQHFKKLNEDCKKLLQLFYYKKVSLKEISDSMGITENSAKNKKYRCMQSLREFYETENSAS